MPPLDDQLRALRAAGQKALIPFITAGDPDLEFTAAAIRSLAEAGATLIEVGLPYSDPIADGPVIQASYTRALSRGVRISQIIEMLRQVRSQVEVPLVVMTSYAIIDRQGTGRFLDQLRDAGVGGAIVPDLPADESQDLYQDCLSRELSLIQLITPTTARKRAKQILEITAGFVYYVSVAGITGERTELPADLIENVSWLREQTDLPVCVGFGISRPEQVRQLQNVADGVIVGSAFVRRITQINQSERAQETQDKLSHNHARESVLEEIREFAVSLAAALREGTM